MNITRLDSYGEGFRVAPRKPHRQPAAQKQKSKSKKRKKRLSLASIVRDRILDDGVIELSEFENRKYVLDVLGKIRDEGWSMYAVKEEKVVVRYILNKQ